MANNKSLGPIQVHANDIDSINDSLRRIQDRIDDIKGLHGRTQIWDRIRADDPAEDQDVLTRGSFTAVSRIDFYMFPANGRWVQPGVSFVELTGADTSYRRYNFTGGNVSSGRLLFHGWGTESGAKSIQVASEDGSQELGIVTWSGTTEGWQIGDVTPFSLTDDQYLKLYAAASSTTEKIVINHLTLELNG